MELASIGLNDARVLSAGALIFVAVSFSEVDVQFHKNVMRARNFGRRPTTQCKRGRGHLLTVATCTCGKTTRGCADRGRSLEARLMRAESRRLWRELRSLLARRGGLKGSSANVLRDRLRAVGPSPCRSAGSFAERRDRLGRLLNPPQCHRFMRLQSPEVAFACSPTS
jgi:hypothetical protein